MNMGLWPFSIAIIAIVASDSARGQIVSMKCCVVESDLAKFADCSTDPIAGAAPDSCQAGATCVLGFGADHAGIEALCDLDAIPINPPRAYCTEWRASNSQPEVYCVAKANSTINLFNTYDEDDDGDLDLTDFGTFQNLYEPIPKQIQSDAVVASVECCLPFSGTQRIAECLSGPGECHDLGYCDLGSICTVGLSAPVEVGDYLDRVCAEGSTALPDPATAFCISWTDPSIDVVFTCQAAYTQGITPFVVMDNDGDGDLDLLDFAAFQNDFGLPDGG